MKLYCCPFAGAGAALYRPWSLPPESGVEIEPVQLAGREEQFDLAPHESIGESAEHVLDQIRRTSESGDEIALFGHSSGAAVAFEVARRVAETGEFRTNRLIASGAPDPMSPLDLGLRGLSDDEFVLAVERIAGYAHPALAEPELREFLLPPLRADLQAREAYVAEAAAVLPVPVTAIRGDRDLLVSASSLAGWAKATSAGCELVEIPGEHMYFLPDPAPLLDLFTRVLGKHARGPVPEQAR